VVVTVAAIVFAMIGLISGCGQTAPNPPQGSASASNATQSEPSVELAASQLNAIKIEPVGIYLFPVEREAIGSIAYDETHSVQVTARNAQAPYTVADFSTKWMVANVTESDSPLFRVGQMVQARVKAYPDRVFDGKISALGGSVWDSGGNPAVDPNTHRVMVRCEIADPKNELYPGMLASIAIRVQDPVESVAIPMTGVVRNGDGTMTAWVTTDRHRFVQRMLKIGLQRDGQYQVLEGLKRGEMAVTNGAIFLSNMLQAPPTD